MARDKSRGRVMSVCVIKLPKTHTQKRVIKNHQK